MFGTFLLTTSHGTLIAADTASGEIVHARPQTIGLLRPQVFVYITRQFLGHAFLLADDAAFRPLAPRHQRPTSPIVVLRHRQLGPPDLCVFSHPQQHTSLLAHPDITPDGMGMLVLHGHNTDAWEQFRLTEPQGGVPVNIRFQITLIDRALATPAIAIPGLLREASASERPVLSCLLASTLSTERAEVLAAYLLQDEKRLAEFTKLLPGDPWAAQALPDLHRFIAARFTETGAIADPPRADAWLPAPQGDTGARVRERAVASLPRPGFLSRILAASPPAPEPPPALPVPKPAPFGVIGPELDRLASDGSDGGFASLPHLCAVTARRAIAPTKDLCILATLCDEGAYVIDWLAYHRSIGVDRIFVYTNNNTDGSDALLQALAAADEITLVRNEIAQGGNPQAKAYGHALSLVPQILDYRWCAVIDADEYIGFDKAVFPSIKDYLLWQEMAPIDAIALNWNMVASSGALRWQDMPLPLRFRQRCAGADPHVKTIIRPRMFHHSSPHLPVGDGRHLVACRDAIGESHEISSPFAKSPHETHAWIAHYFFRSAEEYIWKWSRGRGDGVAFGTGSEINIPEHFIAAFLTQFRDFPLVSDERMADCADGLMAQRERLMRRPGVAAARAAVIEYYRARSAALVPTLRLQRENASASATEFYDLLLEKEPA